MNEKKISGEKIYCEGHRIEKIKQKLLSDGHHGSCTFVKHGFCIVLKNFRWMKE